METRQLPDCPLKALHAPNPVPNDPAAAFNVTGLSAGKYYQYMAIVDKAKVADADEDFKWPDSLLFNAFICLQVRHCDHVILGCFCSTPTSTLVS